MSRIEFLSVAVVLASAACASSTQSAKATSAGRTPPLASAEPHSAAQPGAAPAGATGERVVNGRVEMIDRADEVTLSGAESAGLAFDQFKIDGRTQITANGERATVADVNPGQEVRATLSGSGDQAHVDRLEILPPK